MLLNVVALGLPLGASALNARSNSAHLPQYGHTSSSIGYAAPTHSYAEGTTKALSSPPVYGSTSVSSAEVSSTRQSTTRSLTIAPFPTNWNGTSTSSVPQPTTIPGSCAPYWLENIKHQGLASFNSNPNNYTVFRNVKDFGARGDGVTDDTAAIQRAVTQGNRCGPSACESSTNTPAVVYFPEGTYVISSSIIDYYYTQLIGNPNCPPTLQATANFTGFGLIDGSPYLGTGTRPGKTGFGPTNTFFRQIRNLVLDMTGIPANVAATGVHWPTAQTTSLQNVLFKMATGNGTQHQGLFIEEGSGGFMTDLVFEGGLYGFNVGNQQFTTRNLTFNNVVTAINQLWDWGWTYSGVTINNCQVGLNVSAGGPTAVNVGSITLFDSEINNTPIGIVTARSDGSEPAAAGSLYLENVKMTNVGVAVAGPNSTYLEGTTGSTTIAAWADGHRYLPQGPIKARGSVEPSERPTELLDATGRYYTRSKPQYGSVPLSSFLSVRDLGAAGDGVKDDTTALNAALLKAENEGKILFIDAGFYKVTETIYIPPGSKIVGEALASVIISAGDYFNDIDNPKPVVQVARPGEQGLIEWSDMFVSTQGQQKGAILIEYNLGTYDSPPAGMWDVHTRIGGFAGSNLQTEQCEKTPDVKITPENLVQGCIAAYMSIHVTKWASGLYMENNWLWVADHDLDDARNNNTQLTIYAGRGLQIESQRGRLWLWGTAVEHHVLYEYQLVDTRAIFMGQIQTETAYYQPNPSALIPFSPNPALDDPTFTPSSNTSASTASGWGLRIVRSNNIVAYGAGLYSFFDNYSTKCSDVGAGAVCQARIFSIEGGRSSYALSVYNLNTVGTTSMVVRDGSDLVISRDNNSTFVDTVNVFRVDGYGSDREEENA